MKQYKLLKDLPDRKAGVLFEWNSVFGKYESETEKHELVSQWDKLYVENNPEWFQEVKENKQQVLAGFTHEIESKNGYFFVDSALRKTKDVPAVLILNPNFNKGELALFTEQDMIDFANMVYENKSMDSYKEDLNKWKQQNGR